MDPQMAQYFAANGFNPDSIGGAAPVDRGALAQAVMAQQGMPPPQAEIFRDPSRPQAEIFRDPSRPSSGGIDIARGPDQGASYRQMYPGGFSVDPTNNYVYDPSGALVSKFGAQQYGLMGGGVPGDPNLFNSTEDRGSYDPAGYGEFGPTGMNSPVGAVNPFSEGAATGRFGFGETGNQPFSGRGGGKEGFGEHALSAPAAPAAPPGDFPSAGGGRTVGTIHAGGGYTAYGQPGAPPGAPPSGGRGAPLGTFATGPDPNAPGSTVGTPDPGAFGGFGAPGGFPGGYGGFGAFGGFSGNAGGWGGGFEGSGFNSGGDYSGGYDTAAGAPG